MKIALRNGEALIQATITPIFLMLLFGAVFGNIVDVGGYSYVAFIIPGIILQAIGQASQYTAINVSTDMTKGIIDRFRSMPISKSAFLVGHAGASIVRNAFTAAIILITAFAIGFRPEAGFLDWLLIIGVLLLVVAAITWIAVLCGILAKSPESSSGLMFPLFIIPFISSGFAPTETLHGSIRWFAERQPMTPIINTLRSLMLGRGMGDDFWLAVIWCIGILLVAYIVAVQIYKRKMTK